MRQLLSREHRGWRCGGSANNAHIGVETTEPATIKYTGGANWTETGDGENTKAHALTAYQYAVELFAYLCRRHKFRPLADGVVIFHCGTVRFGYDSAVSSEGESEDVRALSPLRSPVWQQGTNMNGLSKKERQEKSFNLGGHLASIIGSVSNGLADFLPAPNIMLQDNIPTFYYDDFNTNKNVFLVPIFQRT